jgi:hemerythrin superfamily protein
MTTTQQQDVVELLLDQHNQIKALLARITSAKGTDKRDAFEDLVRLLAVHESAEEEIVHPSALKTIDGGDQIVRARRREEDEAKHVLAELYELGVDHPEFDAKFKSFAEAVQAHAAHEETEEFPELRRNTPPQRLSQMASAVKAAEKMAPTRPHPATGESAMANLLTGPPLAIFDRARDRIRERRESNSDK